MCKKKILIVEDEYRRMEALFSDIDKNIYEIVVALNRQEAFDLIERQLSSFCCAIIDLILPAGINYTEDDVDEALHSIDDLEGFNVLKLLEDKKASNIPIIILTIVTQDPASSRLKEIVENKIINIVKIFQKGDLTPSDITEAVENAVDKLSC